jgi:hypothetical protein
MRWWWMVSLAACGGSGGTDEDSGGGPGTGSGPPPTHGACGEVHLEDQPVTVLGSVSDSSDPPHPVEGATVQLEERNWYPGGKVFAEATSDENGAFTLVVSPGITVVDDCWGTAVDYWVTASKGAASGESSINTSLYNAIVGNAAQAADGVAELGLPIALVGATTTPSGSGAP